MSGKTSIAVLGGGSWGTALAHLLAHAGHSVALLLRDAEQAAHINAHHENPRYLRGVQLHPGIRAVAGDTGGPEQAEVGAECEPGFAVRDYDSAFLQGGCHLLRLAGCGLQGHRSGDQAG